MRVTRISRIALDILTVALQVGTCVAIARAQALIPPGPPVPPGAAGPPTMPIGEGNTWLILALLGIAGFVLVAIMAKVIDFKKKRDAEAMRLQAQISDALLRDRMLVSSPVTALVHVPIWWRSPARIEICGDVPTPEHRQTVLYVTAQEASRLRSNFRIRDRITIVPSGTARAA